MGMVSEPQENYKNGWIKIFRSIRNHWIWKDERKLKWWLDIVLEVNHTDKIINIGYDLIECKRGQSIMSLKNWADRWNVSKDTARNFLNLLTKDNMIVLENLIKTTRLTVCNYDSYQDILHDKQTQSKRKTNAKQTQPSYKQECKELKNEIKKENIYKEFAHLKITIEEFEKIKILGYSQNQIDNILLNIENYRKNTNYISLYLTTLKWLKKETPQIKSKGNYIELTEKEKQDRNVNIGWTYIHFKDTYKKVHTDTKGQYFEDNKQKLYL